MPCADAADGSFDPQSLVLVTIGGNDVRDLVKATGDPVAEDKAHEKLQRAADELFDEIEELAARGVSNVVITGIPDVGIIPHYDQDLDGKLDGDPQGGLLLWSAETTEYERATTATAYSRFLDDLIRTEVVPAIRELGVEVTYVPLADVIDEAGSVIEPGALELVIPTIAELNGISPEGLEADILGNRDTIFFDHVHPNAQVHALVGSLIHARLEGLEWIEAGPLDETEIDFAFAGSIDLAGEADEFNVTLVRGVTYTFEMLGMSTLGADGSLADPVFEILDPRGRGVDEFADGSGEDSGYGFDAVLTFTASRSGEYTIRASATGALTGDYVLQGGAIEYLDPVVENTMPGSNFLMLG